MYAFVQEEKAAPDAGDPQVKGASTEEQQMASMGAEQGDDNESDDNGDSSAAVVSKPVEEEAPMEVDDSIEASTSSKSRKDKQSSARMSVPEEPVDEAKQDAPLLKSQPPREGVAGEDIADVAVNTMAPTKPSEQLSEEEIADLRERMETMTAAGASLSVSAAIELWQSLEVVTERLANDLCEQLRLVLEATVTAGLQGDYRTGKRLNMRKVIPYIASSFRKDKIWLRRTRPSKRDYHIGIAIDDSRSMQLYHSQHMALEALSVLSRALSRLQAGRLAVFGFGDQARVLHPFEAPFAAATGPEVIRQFSFAQERTHIGQLLETAAGVFSQAASLRVGGSSLRAVDQLLFVISDTDNLYQEGQSYVEKWCRVAQDQGIFVVFIIIDSPQKQHSVLEQKKVVFKAGVPVTESYMQHFANKNYILLRYVEPPFCANYFAVPPSLTPRDIVALPERVADALRQWFEAIGSQQ